MTAPQKTAICSRCVMDTSDPEIVFDSKGVCNHCHRFDELVRTSVHSGEAGRHELAKLVREIRSEAEGKPYDCVIGVSGGVDSTFVAYQVRKLGLRALAVHLDNGWDSETAVGNIERMLRKLGIELETWVLDWEEFRDLQLAFLYASTPDADVPTDHAIVSAVRLTAERLGIRYILGGGNTRTETHLPRAWSQGHFDWKYVRSVNQAFGRRRLRSYPHMTLPRFSRLLWKQRWINLLDYVDYTRKDALSVLESELDWRSYGGKHYESIYTRFYQGHILPAKFGFDKRRSHLSSLVCSGQISREEALQELKSSPYPDGLLREDLAFVLKKLQITDAEFARIMALPPRSFRDFPSSTKFLEGPIGQSLLSLYRPIKAALRRAT